MLSSRGLEQLEVPKESEVREAAAKAEVAKACVRSRRLSALARDPVPLYEECNQRLEELRQEAAVHCAKVDHRRRQDADLIRKFQSEFAFASAPNSARRSSSNSARGLHLEIALGSAPNSARRSASNSARGSTPSSTRFSDISTIQQENSTRSSREPSSARQRRAGAQPLAEIMPQAQAQRSATPDKWKSRTRAGAQPLAEIMPQAQVQRSATPDKWKSRTRAGAQALSENMSQVRVQRSTTPDKWKCRTPVIDRLMKQNARLSRVQSETGTPSRYGLRESASWQSPRDHSDAGTWETARSQPADENNNPEALGEDFAVSGFQATMLTMGQGGIDILFDALKNYEADSLDRGELIGVLLVLVSHGAPQSLSRARELLLELRRTLTILLDSGCDSEQYRHFQTRICEGCVCFSARADLKRQLLSAPETLLAVLDFMCAADFSEPHLAFAVASFIFNLCQARGDFDKESIAASLLSGVRADSLLAAVYSNVLAAADPGPHELASSLEDIICAPLTQDGGALAGLLLVKCIESGCSNARSLSALTLRLICRSTKHRVPITVSGTVGALLKLLNPKETEMVHDAELGGIRQALAQLCISTDPALISSEDQLRCVSHFVELMRHPVEQLQLDGTMGLTNLLTTGEETRSLALQADAWSLCQGLLFSEGQAVRRAATEAMCNFTAAPEVVEFCASGRGDLEIQAFASFCVVEDHGTKVAATGALAMLARHPDVAARIVGGPGFQRVLEIFSDTEDPDIQHRAASCLSSIFHTPGLSTEFRHRICEAFAEKQRSGGGFVSSEVEALALSIMDDR